MESIPAREYAGPHCPKCGSSMRLVLPNPDKHDWDPFFGCHAWPSCKGTRNTDEDGQPLPTVSEREGQLDYMALEAMARDKDKCIHCGREVDDGLDICKDCYRARHEKDIKDQYLEAGGRP